MKKTLSIILTVILTFSCFGINVSAAEPADEITFGCTAEPSKYEYAAGEQIEASVKITNTSGYILGEVMGYVEYDGDVTLSPVVTEVDTSAKLIPLSGFNPGFTLMGEGNNAFMRIIYKALMFITRTFVIIRGRFNNFTNFFSITAILHHKTEVGRCSIKYDGTDVELIFSISYVILSKGITGSTDLGFDPISAQNIAVNEQDKKLCRDWFDENIVNAGSNDRVPAYDFEIKGKSFRDNLDDWSFTVLCKDQKYEKYRNGLLSRVAFESEKYGIRGMVEAVIYENFATCEWTVYLENTADKDSAKISNFNAIDYDFKLNRPDVYASLGSTSTASDFTLIKVDGTGNHIFDCNNGRSSEYYLPYFNISGKDYGVCAAIGWSGQWQADVDIESDSVSMCAKQATLNAKLVSNEKIRSPLVSLTFYKNSNPIKGFNTFRNHIRGSFLTDKLPDTIVNVDSFFVSPTRTAAETIYDLDRIPDERYENIDNIWVDAGWYCSGSKSIWDDRFGVWQTTENRFPKGMKELADFGKERDTGLVLWFEEERLSNTEESILFREGDAHKGWLLGNYSDDELTTDIVWNFGNEEALQFIRKVIGDEVKADGVTVYREDSNFEPLKFWKYGDKNFYDGRDGICENHYVEGHYRFLDYLFEDCENLEVYDCCASGGRRLDAEVIRRGVPMWRSDYNCAECADTMEGTQSQTYSISFWLPFTGTYSYCASDYRVRTTIYQCYQVYVGTMIDDHDYAEMVKYNPEREMMNGNFYPIAFGGVDFDKVTAMQYGTQDKGFAIIYKRRDVKTESMTFSLSGLDEDSDYIVYNYDIPDDVKSYTGAELMNKTLDIPFGTGEQAIIIEYEKT